jgi:hypothetical protein
MEEKDYREHLVDRAKDMLDNIQDSQYTTSEAPVQEPSEPEGTGIPFVWDPREMEYYESHAGDMDEEDIREFMERDSDFQERLRETDFSGFSRWEERFLITHHSSLEEENLAERLDRDEQEVALKLHAMGLETDEL